jgi:hypothetical protein
LPSIQIQAPTGHQRRKMRRRDLIERMGRSGVVETVAKADDGLWGRGGNVAGQAHERVDAFVGWQHRAAPARGAFGFAHVQVRHDQQTLRRPEQRAGGQGVKRLVAELEDMGVHDPFHAMGGP